MSDTPTPAPSETAVIEEKVKKFVRALQEMHIVNVRVFVTGNSGGVSRGYNFGDGDIYSMLGYVREWLIQHDESARLEERRERDDARI